MGAVFAADLHLLPGPHPADQAALEHFLFEETAPGDAVYFLGDLFHFWFERGGRHVGDYDAVLDALARASAAGRTLHLVYGNRDFPAGPHLAARTGIRLLGAVYVMPLAGERVVLTHGDLLCTRDVNYRVLRWLLMGPIGRVVRVVTPWPVARRLVAAVQSRPKTPFCHAPGARADLIDAAASALLDAHGADRILCGHRHLGELRPLSGGECARTLHILPTWRAEGAHLRVDGDRCEARRQTVRPEKEAFCLTDD